MGTVCSFPPRYLTEISHDPGMQAVSHSLAEALESSDEFQRFARLSEAVNTDLDVYALVQEIRSRRTSYGLAESGELAAKLEALPVMAEYRAAERALRKLFIEVDETVGRAAGFGFSEFVRPQGDG
jgi:cell fate (sporulation/competence/biofilm development) regulator YlbF (YheA/YmcA/DUF963 family)